MHISSRKGFTLIELLVVIAIIAVLAVVVVLTLNPAELLKQSRDANRLSDAQTINSALGIYNTDQSGSQNFTLGSTSVLYISVPDPTATSTAGDQCQGLGLPMLPAGWTYHCAASTTYRNVNGTGWLPVDLKNVSAGSPLGSLPVDPNNSTSSYQYYTYATNGTQYQFYSHFESTKNSPDEGATGGDDPASYKVGSNVNIAPFAGGMTGYWPFSEGSGGTIADQSGYGTTGTLQGGVSWMSGNPSALSFNGVSGYVQLNGNLSSTFTNSSGYTICGWVSIPSNVFSVMTPTEGGSVYLEILGDYEFAMELYTFNVNTNFGVDISNNGEGVASQQTVIPYNGSWHQVCGVVTGKGLGTVYIDGVQSGGANQSFGTTTIIYSTADFGAVNEGTPSNFADVSLRDIRTYDRALSSQEIAGSYTAGN